MKAKQTQPFYKIIQEGINSLLEKVGPKGMAEFFRFFYIGRGNSVKEYKQMWKGMSVEEIHRKILKAKKKKEI